MTTPSSSAPSWPKTSPPWTTVIIIPSPSVVIIIPPEPQTIRDQRIQNQPDTERDQAHDHPPPDLLTPPPLPLLLLEQVPEPSLPELRQQQPVLDAAAALEHPGVLGAAVPLADDVRGAELELRRQRRGAGPLDILVVVVGALVDAAHRVDRGEVADALGGASAGQLRDGREAARGGHLVGAQGEGVDFGEEDGVFAGGLLVRRGSAEGEDRGEEGEEREEEEEESGCRCCWIG